MTLLSEPAVLAALAAYRGHIAAANHRAMQVIVPQIEAAEVEDPDLWESPEEQEQARLHFMERLLGASTELPLERPSDLLEKWDLVVQQVALDGGRVHADPTWRAEKREAYKSGILEGLSHLDLEGPGWYWIRDMGRLIFWVGWGEHGGSEETPEDVSERVVTGETIADTTNEALEQYEIAGGWELGQGDEAVCYAFYSRLKESENQDWSWRYVASLGQFGEEVFDDITGVLAWYKSYSEPEDDDLQISSAEVFQL